MEARNAIVKQSEQSISTSQETQLPEAVAPSHAANVLTTAQDDHNAQTGHLKRTAIATVSQETHSGFEIRLYASTNRLWHTLAGHGPDLSKIKSLDFACLSIIAEHGPNGILQHDLVRISGQDKRSLPARTDRLCDDGYIEKKRVSVDLYDPERLLHTSKCTLMRFVNDVSDSKKQTSMSACTSPEKAKRAKKKEKRKGPGDGDSQAPQRLSSARALERVSGNTALPEDRPIPLWTADRLINNQIFELVDRAGIRGMSMNVSSPFLPRFADLMASLTYQQEIRENLMGDRIRKPLDECVSCLVQCWQISQPLHIRHLSIVRDTLLKGKTQIYMYYTYENFEKLVESGAGFWEAVKTIPGKVAKGKNVAASLIAKPHVDEYGFPILEESLFQGTHNSASLDECISAFKIDPLHGFNNDPVLKRQGDGTYSKQHGARSPLALIKFDLGVLYRNHHQQPVDTNNASNPEAASTSLHAASSEARASTSRKAGRSTPSSKHREVLTNGQAIERRIPRQKHVRNLESRPLGRPRKYPKTGRPSNFDTMKPGEVEMLLQSQENFEKYETARIEKEIIRRVEDGEDAVMTTYEVLTERDDWRKQEGELPIPKASRAHILHKFAGGPLPEPDHDEAKPKGRAWHNIQYRPSIAAHTYFLPTSWKESPSESKRKDSQEMAPILQTRTRRREQDVADPDCQTYFPSMAAHSWPYIDPVTSAVEILTAGASQDSSKRRRGRPPKRRQPHNHRLKYLPSIAAHSGSYLPSVSMSRVRVGQTQKIIANEQLDDMKEHAKSHEHRNTPLVAAKIDQSPPRNVLRAVKAGQKRKRTASISSQIHNDHETSRIASKATPEPCSMTTQEVAVETSHLQHNKDNEGNYPGWDKFMWKYYRQQLEKITRSNASGVFFGETNPRRKRPCEPRGLRPVQFKLVVFKSSRLKEFDWFAQRSIGSRQESCSESRGQTPASRDPEPAPIPTIESTSEAPSDLSCSVSLPQPDRCTSASQRISTYISPYAPHPRTTRKRKTSPQTTHGTAPSDDVAASPQGKQSPPSAKILERISDPNTLLKKTALASGTYQVPQSSTVDYQASARTTEEQLSIDRSSEPTPDVHANNHSNTIQGKIATGQIEQQPQSSTPKANEYSEEHSVSKFSRQGGSTAMLRKNIIMGIVERCEGVFPSHKEMSSPFAAEWKRRGQEGTPEAKTISNAVNALINERRLRQITFTSRTRQGIVITKSMLILPTIDTMDPRVIETQTNMVAFHPRYFIPAAVLPPQQCQSMELCDDKTNDEMYSATVTEGRAGEMSALEVLELRRFYLTRRMMDGKERAAIDRLKALKDQNQEQQGFGYIGGHEPSTKFLFQPDVNSLALAAQGHHREIPPNAFRNRSGKSSGKKRVERLASIQNPISSLAVPLPTTLVKPVSNLVSLTWLPSNYAFSDSNFEGGRPTILMEAARNDLRTGTQEVFKSAGSSDRIRQSIQKRPRNAVQIERNQKLASPYVQPRTTKIVPNKILRSGDSRTLSQRMLLVTFMDPVHYFHSATGTFSVSFSGLLPPRKLFGHRGTASDPYATNLKIIQSHDSHSEIAGSSSLGKVRQSKKMHFDEEVDTLLRRELEETHLNHIVLAGWPFVNHVFSHAHQTVSTMEPDMEALEQVTVRLKDGRLISRPLFRKNSRPKIGSSIFSTGSRNIDHTVPKSWTPLKRRRLTSVLELGTHDEPSKKVELDHENKPAKLRRVRGPRFSKSLGENGEERLLTAVMVIRALTGGLDKRIDWVLVTKVFEPTYTQMFVHSRWNHTLQKYKLILPKMEADFQSIFASAYEKGTIPTIDYDNLEGYDWKWLMEWTMANVHTPSKSLPELPADRSGLDGLYTLTETSENEINEFYEIDGSSSSARRIKVVHRDPYVLPLVPKEQRARSAKGTEDLSTVRSWIRANIITPETTYNPSAARAKLSIFPDRTIEDTLKQLLLDRVFTQENKGRLVPGRNYDISDFFLTRLKKNLLPAHFHRAVAYKQELDHHFEENGFASYSHAADDGDMIVIINLLAHQRIRTVPIDVPMNKWGHLDGGYETRQMDKRRLNFRLELRPSSTYIYGNPLAPLPAPPSQHLQDPMARIPLWYDIHGSLIPVMWDMALAASLAVLAMRPGIDALELEKAMRPAMEAWELQELLEWLVCAKAAKRVGQGFSVADEWWWFALGTGKDGGEPENKDVGSKEQRREANGKGKGKERAEEDVQDVSAMELD